MKELAINRCLSYDTKVSECERFGVKYAIHATHNEELIITAMNDYSKIYAVISMGMVMEPINGSVK